MDKVLNAFISNSDLTEEEIIQIKENYYKLYLAALLEKLQKTAPKAYQLFKNSLVEKQDIQNLQTTLDSIMQDATVREKSDEVLAELLIKLADTVNEKATEEQKQKILNSLTNPK